MQQGYKNTLKKRLRPAPNLSSDFTNGNRKDMHRFGIICAVLRETEAPDILRTSNGYSLVLWGIPICVVPKVFLNRQIKCFSF